MLLDVDNGPDFLVHQSNDRVYRHDVLRALRALLSPGGAVVVWSAAASPDLARAMGAVFPQVREIRRPVDLQGRDEEYFLYTARG